MLANDSDPVPNDTLRVTAVNGHSDQIGQAVIGKYGTLILNVDGSYSYVVNQHNLPPSGAVTDAFSYTASDFYGGYATASFQVEILIPRQAFSGGTGSPMPDRSFDEWQAPFKTLLDRTPLPKSDLGDFSSNFQHVITVGVPSSTTHAPDWHVL